MSSRSIIDANINRVSEGLRVVEDWMRFEKHYDPLVEQIRSIRHDFWDIFKPVYPDMIKDRDVSKDILAGSEEAGRSDETEIPKASFNRVKEGLRVLEEMGKIENKIDPLLVKKLRFRTYEAEKEYYIAEEKNA